MDAICWLTIEIVRKSITKAFDLMKLQLLIGWFVWSRALLKQDMRETVLAFVFIANEFSETRIKIYLYLLLATIWISRSLIRKETHQLHQNRFKLLAEIPFIPARLYKIHSITQCCPQILLTIYWSVKVVPSCHHNDCLENRNIALCLNLMPFQRNW